MTQQIFILPIEPLETRYTAQWYDHVPKLISDHAKRSGKSVEVNVIDGKIISSLPTPGAFLDFAATNVYKSTQIAAMAELFAEHKVRNGDHIIFLDAWHPGIINIKYMKDLLDIDVTLHGLFHAGVYDPYDAISQKIKDHRWANSVEQAYFHAYDYSWFATDFHREMFRHNVMGDMHSDNVLEFYNKARLTGWPMEYMKDLLAPFNTTKTNTILFPHRIAPEKQVEIFRDLAKEMPEYEWIVCQDKVLSKLEYHKLLGRAKLVFSCSKQETLGISSAIEIFSAGGVSLVPDRLSYSEMFSHQFTYPSEWTEDYASYEKHKDDLKARIREVMAEEPVLADAQRAYLQDHFFSATELLLKIFE